MTLLVRDCSNANLGTSNIYLYGGAGFGVNATGFDDVYILSMPSFQWVKWWPSVPDAGHPHNSLSCNVVGNTQMLIIGGTFPAPGDADMCDAPGMYRNLCGRKIIADAKTDVWGTHNLDLCSKPSNEPPWQLFNSNLTNYTVPAGIVDIIGGGYVPSTLSLSFEIGLTVTIT
jgi:hypothetical protein